MMVTLCCNVVVWMGIVIGGNTDNNDNDDNGSLSVYVLICFVIVGGLLLVIFGYCLFHLFLIYKGKTTR